MELSKENLTKAERKAIKALAKAGKEKSQSFDSLDSTDKITVLCVRFGQRYGREYVERLRNMISRHMTIPYEFVCLTDDQHPIPGVRNIVQLNAGYTKGWWHKVHMFDSNLPIKGRILYFDLDIVIHNNIDKLAKYCINDFIGIHDFNRKFYANWKYLNSSVMAWTHGSESRIWEEFRKNPKEAMRLQGDQDWIWKLSRDKIKFWPQDWIMSYKWEIRKKEELTILNGKRQFKNVDHGVQPLSSTSVTVFHGDPKPQDVKDKFVVDNWL